MSYRLPKRLDGPATIGLFAPSGSVDQEALARAADYFAGLGHRVVVEAGSAASWRYFAGTDQQRAASFAALLNDPAIDIMMAARGGYGFTHLLQQLDYAAVAASGKIFVGFSDFTTFGLAALAQAGSVSFAGPMATVDFGNGAVSPYMEGHFWPLLAGATHETGPIACAHPYSPQTISGTLWGSNLSLLAHLVGTPYLPKVEGGVLFVEEIDEQPYAVERLFYQLYHAGVLAKQRCLILGDFAHCTPCNPARYPYCMDEVVERLRALLPYPVLTGLPFGHIKDKLTLPIGGQVEVAIAHNGYALRFSRYNTVPT